jgi:putative hydrolases of HD superfamily
MLAPLPASQRDELVALRDEYEMALTPTAPRAGALDKLETILQHKQGANPPSFGSRFNLGHGRGQTPGHPFSEGVRRTLNTETEWRALKG